MYTLNISKHVITRDSLGKIKTRFRCCEESITV